MVFCCKESDSSTGLRKALFENRVLRVLLGFFGLLLASKIKYDISLRHHNFTLRFILLVYLMRMTQVYHSLALNLTRKALGSSRSTHPRSLMASLWNSCGTVAQCRRHVAHPRACGPQTDEGANGHEGYPVNKRWTY